MTKDEIKLVIKETVKETLLNVGIDYTNPVEVQKDQAYLRTLRTGSETLKSNIFKITLGVLVPSFLYLIWETIEHAKFW